MRKLFLLVSSAAAFCVSTPAAVLVQSTFDASGEGWSVADIASPANGAKPGVVTTYPVSYAATGGNPGGYIYEPDPSDNTYYFQAPAKFLGNQSAAFGGTFIFDVADGPITNFNADESSLILVGTTESIYFPESLAVNPAFTTLSFTLAPGNGGVINGQGGASATLADFTAVLGNLQAVYLLGDYYNGDDTAKLDNVFVNSVPEPNALTIAGVFAAVGMVLWLRRRRVTPRAGGRLPAGSRCELPTAGAAAS